VTNIPIPPGTQRLPETSIPRCRHCGEIIRSSSRRPRGFCSNGCRQAAYRERRRGAPERLVFEGGPILVPPLVQDRDSRRPVAAAGTALDTAAACPPLTIVEKARIEELRTKEAHRLAPESARVRAAYVEQKARDIAKRTGMALPAARRVIERQCSGILLPDVALPFDDEGFAGCTAGDVLADPDRFAGATLADPVEGATYGACVAKIMSRPDGTPWIHSFAHGRATYELTYDAATVRKAIEQADKREVIETSLRWSCSPT
jgi:hypothetical protein